MGAFFLDQLLRTVAETITGIWTFANGLIGNLTTNSTTANLGISGTTIAAGGSDANVSINCIPKGTGGFGVNVASPQASIHMARTPVSASDVAMKLDHSGGGASYGNCLCQLVGDVASGDFGISRSGLAAPQGNSLLFRNNWDNAAANIIFQTIVATNGVNGMVIRNSGKTGFMTAAPDKQVEINSSDGNNLRLTYNDANGSAANYCDLLTTATGDLTVTPSGKDAVFNSSIASNYATDADFDNGDVLSTGIASGYGLLVVKETVTGKSGVFRIENQTIHIVDADASFSVTKDAVSINVYWETDQFKVQNATGNSNYNIIIGVFIV